MEHEHIIALLADLQRTKRMPTETETDHVERVGSLAEKAVLRQLRDCSESYERNPLKSLRPKRQYTLSLSIGEANPEDVRGVYRRIHHYRTSD